MNKKEPEDNRRLILTFPPEEKKKLRKKAKARGLAMSQYARMLILEDLNNKEN